MNYYSFRKKHGLTQAQAASLISMSDATWGALEKGTKDGAELILTRLGGRVPVEQLSLAGVA
jgi:DNA-binding XRE family transcriptional regulator